MKKPVSKLVDLDIDEISLVDRGANQHSLVSFSKSLAEADTSEGYVSDTNIALYDENGEPVDLELLDDGATVFDEDGNALMVQFDDADDEYYDEEQLVGVGKSLSQSILEDFSKAVTDRDREFVIAKAMDEVSKAQQIADEALAYAAAEHDARMTQVFISKAEEYNLPVAPEVLGPILKRLAEVLPEDELDVMDQILNAASDTIYDEIGYIGGGSNSSVLDQVDALASEYVGKSADFSHAQVATAIYENNPALYDAYISEMGR